MADDDYSGFVSEPIPEQPALESVATPTGEPYRPKAFMGVSSAGWDKVLEEEGSTPNPTPGREYQSIYGASSSRYWPGRSQLEDAAFDALHQYGPRSQQGIEALQAFWQSMAQGVDISGVKSEGLKMMMLADIQHRGGRDMVAAVGNPLDYNNLDEAEAINLYTQRRRSLWPGNDSTDSAHRLGRERQWASARIGRGDYSGFVSEGNDYSDFTQEYVHLNAKKEDYSGFLSDSKATPEAKDVPRGTKDESPPSRNAWTDFWNNLFGTAGQTGFGLDVAKAKEDLNRAKSGEVKPTLFGAAQEKEEQALKDPNISQADAEEIIERRRARTEMDQKIAELQLKRAEVEEAKAKAITPGPEYQRTIPGTISTFLGQSAPYLLSGTLGAASPFVMASQMSEQAYGDTFDRGMKQGRQAHPEWTDEQLRQYADKAARAAAQTGFENGVVLSMMHIPKVGPLFTQLVTRLGMRGAFMVIAGASQDIEENIQIKKGVDQNQSIYEGVLAHAPANFVAGAAFEAPGAIGEAIRARGGTPERAAPQVSTPQVPPTAPEVKPQAPVAPDPVVEKLNLLGLPDNQVSRAIAARALRADSGDEALLVPAVKDTRTGQIVTDAQGHAVAVRKLLGTEVEGPKPDYVEYGYLTNTGRYATSPMDLARQIEAGTRETDEWVSRIANRYAQERSARGEIGEVAPGEGYATTDLLNVGLRMKPEEINQHISDLMHDTGDPKLQAAAVRAKEARLSERSSRLSRTAENNPADTQAKINADNAFNDLTDFHNGPVAKLKNNWHAQGMTLQGEVPVDLGSFNGLREAWLRDIGTKPSPEVESKMRDTAKRVREAEAAADSALEKIGQAAIKSALEKRLARAEEVRNNIMERLKDDPCITP